MRKGDLALSTSAIVVLIVAIVVLGIIVTFIIKGFGSVDDQLEKEAMRLPEPPRPTSAQPITMSTATTAKIGGDFLAKVSVYNPCQVAVNAQIVDVACTDTIGGFPVTLSVVGNDMEIQSGQTATLTFLGTVTADGPGNSLCTVDGGVVITNAPTDCALLQAKYTVPVEFIE